VYKILVKPVLKYCAIYGHEVKGKRLLEAEEMRISRGNWAYTIRRKEILT
jgi:hypothetical protein